MTDVFDIAAADFELSALRMTRILTGSRSAAISMLDRFQPWVYRTSDDMPRHRRVATSHEFLEHHPHFSGYLEVVHDHPVDYVGNVGHVFLDALPKSGFCGSVTMTFIGVGDEAINTGSREA